MMTQLDMLFLFIILTPFQCFTSAHSPPMLVTNQASHTIMVKPYGSVVLDCPVRHNRQNIFEWYKEKSLILPFADQRVKIMSNGGLKIKEIMFEDTGFYRCRAVNGFGSVEFNTTLLVVGKGSGRDYYDYDMGHGREDVPIAESKISLTYLPRILYVSDTSTPIYKQIGETFKLQCVATGFPTPEILWYKDGVQITGARIGRWTLVFNGAILPDSGNYTCSAMNSLGRDNYTFTLVVDPYGSALRRRPVLTGENVTVDLGHKAVMECVVHSIPLLHIEWLKQVDEDHINMETDEAPITMDGEFFNVLENKHRVETITKGNEHYHRLIFDDAQLDDGGKYVCLGANTHGYEYLFAYLNVIPKEVEFNSSLNFTIIVTVISVAVIAAVSIVGCLIYCHPRKNRRSTRGSADTSNDTEESIPMQPRRPEISINQQIPTTTHVQPNVCIDDGAVMIYTETVPPNTPVDYGRASGSRSSNMRGARNKYSHHSAYDSIASLNSMSSNI